MAKLEYWLMWREKCALSLCALDAQAELSAFAHARFRRYVEMCLGVTNLTNPAAAVPSAGEAWHRFETAARIRNTRQGKAYKEWLFSRSPASEPDYDAIQGGASLIIRDVVRDYLSSEFPPSAFVSTVSAGGPACAAQEDSEELSLSELIPDDCDVAESVANRELAEIARRPAMGLFALMGRHERVAMLARNLGLSLAHPAVVRASGCGKTKLSAICNKTMQAVGEALRVEFRGEDRSTGSLLAIFALRELMDLIVDWGSAEKKSAKLFKYIGGTAREAKAHGCGQTKKCASS